MHSQCIQVSSLKSISVPNVRVFFHIYTARQSATLKKKFESDGLCGNMNMDASLLLHIEIEILLQEYLLYNDAWIHIGLL